MIKKIHKNLSRIINILNDGEYHNGNVIGKALKISRSAVWKAIHKLKKYGIEIHSTKGKGYRLPHSLILMDPLIIKKELKVSKVALEVFESINSTNDYLKSIKKNKIPAICIAEHQTAGKARLNRTWHSPFGKNIYLSCRFPFYKEVGELAGLSLVTALAVFKTVSGYVADPHLCVKWPNDIYFAKKKLSGILLEVQSESREGLSHAIIGIGINVNVAGYETMVSQNWGCMQKILQRPLDRNKVASHLINNLMDYLEKFDKEGFAPFIDEWASIDCLNNTKITLKNITRKFTGMARGINTQGQLLLELADGQTRAFSSGEVTVLMKK